MWATVSGYTEAIPTGERIINARYATNKHRETRDAKTRAILIENITLPNKSVYLYICHIAYTHHDFLPPTLVHCPPYAESYPEGKGSHYQ